MNVSQQPETAPARGEESSSIRWIMFWLFWFYYALAGFELVRALRRLSDGLELSVATFAALSFLAGLLVAAVLCAHSEGVGLLVWVERLPDRLMQSVQLTGLVLILTALASTTPWGTGIEELHDPTFMLGFGLTALAVFCNVRPLVGRRRA
ncbi:MAG: hypothetical protein OXG83_01165 [Acidobacteria bacterium]|nr:hypothetical protein [Acidobacteriota bacterium]